MNAPSLSSGGWVCACCAHRLLWGHCGLIRTLRDSARWEPSCPSYPSEFNWRRTAKMLLVLLLLTSLGCLSPGALGQLEESQFGDEIDLTDFDLDIVRELKDERVAHSAVFGFLYLTLFVCAHRRHAESHGR